jgi:hypothetical protein
MGLKLAGEPLFLRENLFLLNKKLREAKNP